jgi:hypothetical protein
MAFLHISLSSTILWLLLIVPVKWNCWIIDVWAKPVTGLTLGRVFVICCWCSSLGFGSADGYSWEGRLLQVQHEGLSGIGGVFLRGQYFNADVLLNVYSQDHISCNDLAIASYNSIIPGIQSVSKQWRWYMIDLQLGFLGSGHASSSTVVHIVFFKHVLFHSLHLHSIISGESLYFIYHYCVTGL